jgi:hypothetical protein
MSQWQTAKLFLSSTFRDWELARDEIVRTFDHYQFRMSLHKPRKF